jgi:hypothetical protein
MDSAVWQVSGASYSQIIMPLDVELMELPVEPLALALVGPPLVAGPLVGPVALPPTPVIRPPSPLPPPPMESISEPSAQAKNEAIPSRSKAKDERSIEGS